MNKTKRFFSLVLAVLMLLSISPMAYAESDTYQVGDIIQFGSYPQSEVTDETIIAELNALAPEWEDWTSYGYYSGNGNYGSMVQGDRMRYTDVTYNGNKYRGVKFTEYRATMTYYSSSAFGFQYYNGYLRDTIYWFSFDPVDWRVLDPEKGLILCETIIDTQAYNNTVYFTGEEGWDDFSYFSDPTFTNFASDYETSSIRKWLNEDFYNTAFTVSEKKEISTTALNNDSYLTTGGYIDDGKPFDSNPTNDKIFMLSRIDICNVNYGFAESVTEYNENRIAYGSDYALSQGLSGEDWLLRTPGSWSRTCCYVSGGYMTEDYAACASYGIRPALCLRDIYNYKHTEHSYDAVITAPTCTDKGYTTYTCECGDSYVSDYKDIIPHTDTNSDYKCDYGCGYEFEKPAKPCSCNCHAGGIKKFFFNFILFFQKLFKKNAVCACGVAHY